MAFGKFQQSTKFAFWFSIYAVLAVLAAWTTYLEWHGLRNMHLLGYDYVFFYHAFQVIQNHEPLSVLYNLPSQQRFLLHLHYPIIHYNQYVYPPQFAFFLAAFAITNFHMSQLIWGILSTAFYALAIFLNLRMLWPHVGRKLKTIIVVLLLISTPFQIDIGVGNVNSILFAAVTLTFYLLYKSRKPWLAGIPLALAILIKVTPAVIVLYLLFRRQWRTSLSAALTVAGLSVITAWQLGWGILFTYVSKFVAFGKTSEKHGPAPFNQSFKGVIGSFVQHHWLNLSPHAQNLLFYIFVVFALLVVASVLTRNTLVDWRLDYALASLTPLIFSPLVEEMHMILSIPAILTLMTMAPRLRQPAGGDSKNLDWQPVLHRRRLRRRLTTRIAQRIPVLIGAISLVILSLPTTFILNDITAVWPQLFWMHAQMFWVLIAVFLMTAWRMRQPAWQSSSLADRPRTNGPGTRQGARQGA